MHVREFPSQAGVSKQEQGQGHSVLSPLPVQACTQMSLTHLTLAHSSVLIPGAFSSEPQGLLSLVLFLSLSSVPESQPQGCVAAFCYPRDCPPARGLRGGEGHGPFSGDHQQTLSIPSLSIRLPPPSHSSSGQGRGGEAGDLTQHVAFQVCCFIQAAFDFLGCGIQSAQEVRTFSLATGRSLPAAVKDTKKGEQTGSCQSSEWGGAAPVCGRIPETRDA